MSSSRMQQLLALKEELGPPELKEHERYTPQQHRQVQKRAAAEQQKTVELQHKSVFPYGQDLVRLPSQYPLDANSQKAAMQELISMLQKFFPAGDVSTWSDETQLDLVNVRTSLFRILVQDNWGPGIFWGKGIESLDMLNDEPLKLLLECFCKVVHQYKKQQQLMLVFGGNKALYTQQNGNAAVQVWCTTLFGGVDPVAIAQGAFGWNDRLLEFLKPQFSWRPEDSDPKLVHGGRHVLHYRADPVPQAKVFQALQHSRLFRQIFDSLNVPGYAPSRGLYDIGISGVSKHGGPRELGLELLSLARVKGWDEKNGVAHMEQLGWNVTEKHVVVPLALCPDGKKDKMTPGTVISYGKLVFKEAVTPTLAERWVPASKVAVVRKAPPKPQQQQQGKHSPHQHQHNQKGKKYKNKNKYNNNNSGNNNNSNYNNNNNSNNNQYNNNNNNNNRRRGRGNSGRGNSGRNNY